MRADFLASSSALMTSIEARISVASSPLALACPINLERDLRSFCKDSVSSCRVLRLESTDSRSCTSKTNFFFASCVANSSISARRRFGSNIVFSYGERISRSATRKSSLTACRRKSRQGRVLHCPSHTPAQYCNCPAAVTEASRGRMRKMS